MGAEEKSDPPSSEDASSPPTLAATYHLEDGEWYQSRVTGETKGPIADDDDDQWYYGFKSKMSVWRFNPVTGDYDILVPGSQEVSLTMRFRYSKGGDGKVLMMSEAMSSLYSLGGAGLPNGGGTEMRMELIPPIFADSNITEIENALHLTVITRVSVRPSPASKERGVPVKSTEVSRSLLVKRLPGNGQSLSKRTSSRRAPIPF